MKNNNLKYLEVSFLTLFLLSSCFLTFAQNEKDFNLDFYGFIRNEVFVDTYKGIDGANEQFYLLPVYVGVDANGEDINKQLSANMTAVATRMGVHIAGPELMGGKLLGNIEFDFGGIVSSEPSLFRIRKAYCALVWSNSKLLMGQDWHPFWSGDIFPSVGSLNTGSPFQPFNRSPQLRYDYRLGKFKYTAAAVYQLQYTSPSLNSSSQSTASQAKRNGVIPELVGNVEFRNKSFAMGAGWSYNRTKPKMTVTNNAGELFKADEFLSSMAFIGYAQYKKEKLKIQVKSVYGQNLKHLLMPGGYGVSSYDALTGSESYTNYNNVSGYLNLVYGKKWQVGLMVGYGKNLGTVDPLIDTGDGKATVAGLFTKAQDLGRIAPHVALNVSKLRLVLEYEYTTMNYGIDGFKFEDGLYDNTHDVDNHRIAFVLMYFF